MSPAGLSGHGAGGRLAEEAIVGSNTLSIIVIQVILSVRSRSSHHLWGS